MRFRVGPEMAAQVHTHAVLAAKLIDRVVGSKEHYDGVIAEVRAMRGDEPVDRDMAAQWSGLADQLLAAREDLLRLAADAQSDGSDPLKSRRLSMDPKTDTSLSAPRTSDPIELMTTLHVMMDGLRRNCRDAADQIERLLVPMSKVADPAVLAFASELETLRTRLRPPGMEPGSYAPRQSGRE